MTQTTASRRLVKSPPELWAELSSEDVLNRHLAGFGEIRITEIEPETTVAWEGDRISGTVELAPTGWGTKVVLTATPAAQLAADPAPPDEPAADVPPPSPAGDARPVAAIELPTATGDAPTAASDRRPRRGFLARLLGRSRPTAPVAAIPGPPAPTPDPTPPAPAPSPGPVPPAPDPEPPTPTPRPPSPPSIQAPDAEHAMDILSGVLDELGAAHHRPFSRD